MDLSVGIQTFTHGPSGSEVDTGPTDAYSGGVLLSVFDPEIGRLAFAYVSPADVEPFIAAVRAAANATRPPTHPAP